MDTVAWEGSSRFKAGLLRTHGFPTFSVSSPSMRNQDQTKIFPEVESVQGNVKVRVSRTLTEVFSAYGGVGRLKSLKSRAFTDPLIIVHFGHFPLVARPRQD